MRFAIFARFALVAGIALLLLVPLRLIHEKIAERQGRAAAVQQTFAQETSGPQSIAGPFLALRCEETYPDRHWVHPKEGAPQAVETKKVRACPTALFPPRTLTIAGKVPVKVRYRGIYPIRLYQAELDLSGSFTVPPPPAPVGGSTYAWKDAFVVLAISDVRGIKDPAGARIGGASREFRPGAGDTRIASGLHASLGAAAALKPDLEFRIPLSMSGTASLALAPLGDQNEIRLASDWPHPSFIGGHSPDARDITDAGFTAAWHVSHLATGGRPVWQEAAIGEKLFAVSRLVGFSLAEPVNPYTMSYRATEYGFLFVLLTFAAFVAVEVIWGVRMHAVQYMLAGLALAVFFLLLIALSEHARFDWAYAAASAACVALLTFYLRHPLGSLARTGAFGALFAALYTALYVLLRSEDHALLLGALLVFGALAAVMALTRKLDWAELSKRLALP